VIVQHALFGTLDTCMGSDLVPQYEQLGPVRTAKKVLKVHHPSPPAANWCIVIVVWVVEQAQVWQLIEFTK
jgi:hypothetical protein